MTMTIDEVETALLGSLILDPGQCDVVASEVTAHDFADADLGTLFERLVDLHAAGVPIGDPKVLLPELARAGVPEAVRTPAFVGKLFTSTTAGHARFYALEVRRASQLRSLETLGRTLASKAGAGKADPDEVAQWLDANLSGLGHDQGDQCRSIGEVAADFVAELKKPQARGRVVMSGIRSVDETVGGFAGGELIILAARTSIGKTALAMQVATDVAARGRSVLFVSLEMRDGELVSRILCGQSGVSASRVRSGAVSEDDLGRLEWHSGKIAKHPLFVFDPPRASMARIRGQAKRVQAARGLDLLIVDYVGLVTPADRKRQRYEQVSEITADLKALSKELNVPVLTLAQLNREADGQPPKLSHLRESGSIEQDADCVLLLHRDDPRATETKLIIGKNRHGETGMLRLLWSPEKLRFECGGF